MEFNTGSGQKVSSLPLLQLLIKQSRDHRRRPPAHRPAGRAGGHSADDEPFAASDVIRRPARYPAKRLVSLPG